MAASLNVVEILVAAKDEASGVLNKVAAESGGLVGSLGKITAVAGPIGAVTGTLIALSGAAFVAARSLADTAVELTNLQHSTGVSVGNMQVLRQALEEFGVGADSADRSLVFLERAIARQDPLLQHLHVTTRDTWEAFNQLARIFAASADSSARARAAQDLFGRGGIDLLKVFDRLADKLPETAKEMEKAGAIMSPTLVDKALALKEKLNDLDVRWKGMMLNVKEAMLPWGQAIVDVFNNIAAASDRTQKHIFSFEDLKKAAEGATPKPSGGPVTQGTLQSRGLAALERIPNAVAPVAEALGKALSPDAATLVAHALENVGKAANDAKPKVDELKAAVDAIFAGQKDERTKGIAELITRMHIGRVEAGALYDVLKKIDDTKFGEEKRKEVADFKEREAGIEKIGHALGNIGPLTREAAAEAGKLYDIHKKYIDAKTSAREQGIEDIIDKYGKARDAAAAFYDEKVKAEQIKFQTTENELTNLQRKLVIDREEALRLNAALHALPEAAKGLSRQSEWYLTIAELEAKIRAAADPIEQFKARMAIALEAIHGIVSSAFSAIESRGNVFKAFMVGVWRSMLNAIEQLIDEWLQRVALKLFLKLAIQLASGGTLPGAPGGIDTPLPAGPGLPTPGGGLASLAPVTPPTAIRVAPPGQVLAALAPANVPRNAIVAAVGVPSSPQAAVVASLPRPPQAQQAASLEAKTRQNAPPPMRGGDTYYFTSLGYETAIAAITGPSGPFRRAFDRMAVGNAY